MSLTVIWQLTRECDLGCEHCIMVPRKATHELTTYEAYRTIDQIATAKPERFVISGGDPLARRDIFELVQYARRRGVNPAVVVSPTRKLTAENVSKLRTNGVTKLIFSMNGTSPQRHDAISGAPGSFAATVRAIRWARDAGISVEINTLVTCGSVSELAAIAETIDSFHIVAWNVYFLVPVPASRRNDGISPAEAETAFAALSAIASLSKYRIRVVEAPQFRRYLVKKNDWADFAGYVDNAEIVDEVVFVTADGDVQPSEFLPLSAGNLREQPLKTILRSSDLLNALRDRSNLNGKCKRCEYRNSCGGSRARAWAATGDLFASDPLCAYEPPAALAAAAG
ncbi:MAG TPA: radical SAM protein [Thermoanaerobaculia bacterium]|nr:radical SAM protein [Thermoanaerobaculia bacterium]